MYQTLKRIIDRVTLRDVVDVIPYVIVFVSGTFVLNIIYDYLERSQQ